MSTAGTPVAVIQVKYAYIGGAHFFTSDDKWSVGLCAAHQDLKTAFDETAVQLKTLLKLNHDIHEEVTPSIEFEEFAKLVSLNSPTPHVRPRVASGVDWYLGERNAA